MSIVKLFSILLVAIQDHAVLYSPSSHPGSCFFFVVIKTWPSRIAIPVFRGLWNLLENRGTHQLRHCTHLKWGQCISIFSALGEEGSCIQGLPNNFSSFLINQGKGRRDWGFHLGVGLLWVCVASEFKSLLLFMRTKCIPLIRSISTAFKPKILDYRVVLHWQGVGMKPRVLGLPSERNRRSLYFLRAIPKKQPLPFGKVAFWSFSWRSG